nr:MAG: RNA-dependent RNA-polymerase [Picobirnavirus sp.]
MKHSDFVNACASCRYITVVPLWPDKQLELDPTGKATQFVTRLIAADEITNMTPKSPDFSSSIDWREVYLHFKGKNYTDKHSYYWEFSDSFLAKMDRQGGTVPMHLILDSLKESYTRAHFKRRFDVLNYGKKILLGMIDSRIQRVGLPQRVDYSNCEKNSALPVMSKKTHYLAETVGMGPWRHVWPDLVGTRYQFQKPRTIHQDSVNNINIVAEYLKRVRGWMVREFPELFNGWTNYRGTTSRELTLGISRGDINYEGDFEHMDEGFGKPIAIKFLLPIFERLLDPGEFLHFAAYVEEMWTQPIFMGSFCLCGEHDLLSGVGPTQDFETYYGVMLHLGANFVSGGKARSYSGIGDDSIALFPKKCLGNARAYKEAIESEAALNGMRFNLEKCRFNTPDYRFCKRIWYPGAPTTWINGECRQIGGYPYTRVMTAMAMPERSTAPRNLVAAQMSRLDNSYGSPSWAQFCDLMYKLSNWDLYTVDDANLEELAQSDWWYRVYGERWDPQSSVSYRYLTGTLDRS